MHRSSLYGDTSAHPKLDHRNSMSPLHTLAPVPACGALEDALAASLAGVSFADTAFHAPTSRGPSASCRAVRANSHILKAVSPYFRQLLSGDSSRVRGPARLSDDEDDNSDVEDDDELPLQEAKNQDREDDLESFPGTPSDFTLAEFEALEELPADTPTIRKPDDLDVARKNPTEPSSSAHCGTGVVHLDFVAADTLEAAIFYLYTGQVYFLPLRSRGAEVRKKALSKHCKTHQHRPACSPKSMYRFACEAGLDELKALAEAHLFAQLDGETILPELFSRFSARHPEILQRQAALLLRDYWTSAARAALAPLMERVVQGKMPHAAPALLLLLSAIPEPIPGPTLEEPPRKDALDVAQERAAAHDPVAASSASRDATSSDTPQRGNSAQLDPPSACAAQGAARTAAQDSPKEAQPAAASAAPARATSVQLFVQPAVDPSRATASVTADTNVTVPLPVTVPAPTPSERTLTTCAPVPTPAPPDGLAREASSANATRAGGEESASSVSVPAHLRSDKAGQNKRSVDMRKAAKQPANPFASLDKARSPWQGTPIMVETSRRPEQRAPSQAGSDWFSRLAKVAAKSIDSALAEDRDTALGTGTKGGPPTKQAPATTATPERKDPVRARDSRSTGNNTLSADRTASDAKAAELLPPLHVNPWEKHVRAEGGQEPDR